MSTKYITFAEIEANDLCVKAGKMQMNTKQTFDACAYILDLAERIKNQRILAILNKD